MGPAVLSSVLAALLAQAAPAQEFPLRSTYPEVVPITTAELQARYAECVVVDVRSKLEFDVVHINKATHLAVARHDFAERIAELRAKNPTAPIVLYCNGRTCAKSYRGARSALRAGVDNVFAYDSGIRDWQKEHPELTTLMGTSPADPSDNIDDAAFERHLLDYNRFAANAAGSGAMVIDIREPYQYHRQPGANDQDLPQSAKLPLRDVREIPSDRLVELLRRGSFKDKRLLIFDAVGKQIRWLQYSLERYGYSDYQFLAGGVRAAVEAGAVE